MAAFKDSMVLRNFYSISFKILSLFHGLQNRDIAGLKYVSSSLQKLPFKNCCQARPCYILAALLQPLTSKHTWFSDGLDQFQIVKGEFFISLQRIHLYSEIPLPQSSIKQQSQ